WPHRVRLSSAAPVVWNVAMLAPLPFCGPRESLPRLAVTLGWGSVVGSAAMIAIQLPPVFRVAPDVRFALDVASQEVRTVVRNFGPVFISRGAVQVSAYIDTLLASLLPTGAVAGLLNAQLLYLLAVSLVRLSVSAARVPAMCVVLAV